MKTVSRTHRAAARIAATLLAILLAFAAMPLAGCSGTGHGGGGQSASAAAPDASGSEQEAVSESGTYTGKAQVARYIHLYGHLPSNFVSKTKARKAGWVPAHGNLQDVLPGKSIGGGPFYNDDGKLPDAPGRSWRECDIDYHGGTRGPKRLVYSSDGLVYYTADHYEHFERMY